MARELTAERLRELLHYDPETGVFRWRVPRGKNRVKVGTIAGSLNQDGYLKVKVDGHHCLIHRLAWFYMTEKWPPGKIDHKDGDPLNNRWTNLRCATDAENSTNRRTMGNNALGIKGVRLHCYGRFEAQITVGKKQHYLGLFDTAEEAHAAYSRASAELHGEFGRTK